MLCIVHRILIYGKLLAERPQLLLIKAYIAVEVSLQLD
jgi:hypothetical protein